MVHSVARCLILLLAFLMVDRTTSILQAQTTTPEYVDGLLSSEIIEDIDTGVYSQRLVLNDGVAKFEVIGRGPDRKSWEQLVGEKVRVYKLASDESPLPAPSLAARLPMSPLPTLFTASIVALSRASASLQQAAPSPTATSSPRPSPAVHTIVALVITFDRAQVAHPKKEGVILNVSDTPPIKEVEQMLYPSTEEKELPKYNVYDYYDTVSRGTIHFKPSPLTKRPKAVLGPYTVPLFEWGDQGGGDDLCYAYNWWLEQAKKQAIKSGDLKQPLNGADQHYVVVMNKAIPYACGWSGKGTLGESPNEAWVGWYVYTGEGTIPRKNLLGVRLRTFVHELGHNLNLHHAARLLRNGAFPNDLVEYGDYSSEMSGGNRLSGHNDVHLSTLGVFKAGDPAVKTIRAAGEFRIRLKPIDAVRVPTDPTPGMVVIDLADSQYLYYLSIRSDANPTLITAFQEQRPEFKRGIALHGRIRANSDLAFDESVTIGTLHSILFGLTNTTDNGQSKYWDVSTDTKQVFANTGKRTISAEIVQSTPSYVEVRLVIPTVDFDGDGIAENRDTDHDNDGVLNVRDCAPIDRERWRDRVFQDWNRDGKLSSGELVTTTKCFGKTAPSGYIAAP